MICKLKSAAIVTMLLLCVFASCAKSKNSGTTESASVDSAQPKQVTVWFCFSKDLPSPLPTEKYDKETLDFMRLANLEHGFYKLKEDMNLSDEAFEKLSEDRKLFDSVLFAEPLVLNKPEKGDTIVYELPVCLLGEYFWSCNMDTNFGVRDELPYYNGCFEGWRTQDDELVTSLEITASTKSDIYLRPSYRDPKIGDKVFSLKNLTDDGFSPDFPDSVGSTVYAGRPVEVFGRSDFGSITAIVSPKLDVHEVLVDCSSEHVIFPIEVFKVAKELGRVCFFMKRDESDKFTDPLSQFEDGADGYFMPYDFINLDEFTDFVADYSAMPENVKELFGRVTNGHNISYAKFYGNKDVVYLRDVKSRDDTFSPLKYVAFALADKFDEIKWNRKIYMPFACIPSMAQWKIIYDNIDAFSESKYDLKYKFGGPVISSSLDGGMFATLNMITGEIISDVGIGNRLFVVSSIPCGIHR